MVNTHRLLFCLTFLFCISTFVRAQENNIVNFYPHVDTVIQFPEAEQHLKFICQKRIDKRYVSFIGLQNSSKVLLAAVTLQPLDSVEKNLSLFVEFQGPKPSVGKVSSWAYVYDRNHDGIIDYMAMLAGAAAIERDDIPADFPKRGKPLNRDQLELFVSHCSLLFDHWADDNFDEKLDAVVHIDMDPERDWMSRHIVVRSKKFNNKFDEVWAFTEEHGDDPQKIPYTKDRVQYRPIDKDKDEITKKTFQDKTEILKLLNRAAKVCGLTGKSFNPKLPDEE